MKLVRSTGKEILIYELPEPIWRLAMGRGPTRAHGFFLLTDDAALDLVHDLVVVQRGPAAWTE